MHCDLYRCSGYMPEEIEDYLVRKDVHIMMEWAQYLVWKPIEFLDISFNVVKDARILNFNWQGEWPERVAGELLSS